MVSRTTGKLLRRKKDGGYESFSYDGSTTRHDPNLSEGAAREMWARGGYDEVGDADFEALRDVAYGRPSTADEAAADFRAGAPAFAASNTADAKGGPSKWAEDDFRAGAPKVGRVDDYHDAKMDGLSNPSARPDMTAMDGPRNPNPMPRAGMKGAGKGRPSIAVGMPAADRAAAGRLPSQSAAPAAALRALQSPEAAAEVARAADPYGDARAEANRNRFFTNLARAGAMANEAVSGARYDRTAYDDLDAQAEQPVADFLARRELGREDAAAASAADERRLRAEDYARRWASGEREFQYRQGRDKVGDALDRDKMAANERQWRAELGARGADRMEARQARLDARTAASEERNERARANREAHAQEVAQKSLQTLGQQTGKLPIGELQQALEDIEASAPGMAFGQAPDDNPLSLKDRIARKIPYGAGEWVMSDEGKHYASNIAQLRDIVMRMRSGAAINKSEERHYLALLGDDVLSDPQKAAYGINTVRRGLSQRLRNIQAPYAGNGALDEYERQGGSTYRAPIFSDEAPQSRQQTGTPTGRTVTRKDGSVWAEMTDGTAQRVR